MPAKRIKRADTYRHTEDALLRPEAGMQAQFRNKKDPKTHRYDSSLSPALDWDGQNWARELGEWLFQQMVESSLLGPPYRFPEPRRYGDVVVQGLEDTVEELKQIAKPFLDWAGKAERLSFDVPTLPLFIHERLATKVILETLKGHERDRQMELQLFGDPQLSLAQRLEAYEHVGGWVNRLILGDSLIVTNSLLEYEGLGGQVQMIYVDPPYGVKYGSNFQPFVRKRGVTHGDDAAMTREPEMVKAYRDTWELGLHSYLTYLRDRLLVARELLAQSGSIFVQINDERIHHVREVMDEVFDPENFVAVIAFAKTQGSESATIATIGDFLLWYARDREQLKVHKLFQEQEIVPGGSNASWILLPDGSYRGVNAAEKRGDQQIPDEGKLYYPDNITSSDAPSQSQPFEYEGKTYFPPANTHWKAHFPAGMQRLADAGRIHAAKKGNSIRYRRFARDFPFQDLTNIWMDTSTGQFTPDKIYVVQTPTKVVERCLLMTTDPGDLVLDPTCGSGTTAYVAEQWGRRWITIDTSRVPLALTRQRLLTATFPFYELQDQGLGPAGGFVYQRRQNKKGEEVGGIVPHITLESIANEEPPKQEVLVGRPDVDSSVTRVTGPFALEATIPTPLDVDQEEEPEATADGSFLDRMLEALRRNPTLQLSRNRTITLANIRPPAQSLYLAAEAEMEPDETSVALLFGPENGAIGEKLIFEGAREAHARNYQQLVVVGFAIEAGARDLVERSGDFIGIPATYVQATPDLVMGDLLKTLRSSQIFSVAGLPDVAIHKVNGKKGAESLYQVELRGVDVFDPSSMEVDHRSGTDVPAWFLDTDYNELCFHVSQAFFPRTGAWDSLRKALGSQFEDSVWDHLAGAISTPFTPGQTGRVAVKVIDDRGNELLAVKMLEEQA